MFEDSNNLVETVKKPDVYLKLKINRATTAIMTSKYTQEVMVLEAESLTAIPNMPPCILGLMNWHNRILWVVDLARMLNLESMDKFCQYAVVIIQIESSLLALVVQEVKGTSKFIVNDIQSAVDKVISSLLPYVQGCIVEQEELLLVLDVPAILDSPVLHNK